MVRSEGQLIVIYSLAAGSKYIAGVVDEYVYVVMLRVVASSELADRLEVGQVNEISTDRRASLFLDGANRLFRSIAGTRSDGYPRPLLSELCCRREPDPRASSGDENVLVRNVPCHARGG